jgi:hypothetical protein
LAAGCVIETVTVSECLGFDSHGQASEKHADGEQSVETTRIVFHIRIERRPGVVLISLLPLSHFAAAVNAALTPFFQHRCQFNAPNAWPIRTTSSTGLLVKGEMPPSGYQAFYRHSPSAVSRLWLANKGWLRAHDKILR